MRFIGDINMQFPWLQFIKKNNTVILYVIQVSYHIKMYVAAPCTAPSESQSSNEHSTQIILESSQGLHVAKPLPLATLKRGL